MSFKQLNIPDFVIFIFLTAVNTATANNKVLKLEKACNNGFAKAYANLAYMYENGHGVEQDYVVAAKFYRKACDARILDTCFNLPSCMPLRKRQQKITLKS